MHSELDRSRLVVRLMSILMALYITQNFISPALWILGEITTIVGTTARLATSPDLLALTWLLSALMVVPYVLMQVWAPGCQFRRRITKCACNGVCLGGVLWVYLAYLSKNLDYGIATSLFIFNGLSSVALGAVLAYGLNSEQIQSQPENTLHEA